MLLLPELLSVRFKVDSPESFGLLMIAVIIGLCIAGIDNEIYRKRGTSVDSGRGLSLDRVALSGVPLTLTCQGITLNGIILDGEAGAWALAHLPSSLDVQKYLFHGGGTHISFLFARFGDDALAAEVLKMSQSQSPREGDVTLASVDEWDGTGKRTIVELRVWGSSHTLTQGGKKVLVGRLDYASMLALRRIKGENWFTNSGPAGKLTITCGAETVANSDM